MEYDLISRGRDSIESDKKSLGQNITASLSNKSFRCVAKPGQDYS